MKKPTKMIILCSAMIFVFVIIFNISNQSKTSDERRESERIQIQDNIEAIDKINEGITPDYSAVKVGMTFAQVKKIVGVPYRKDIYEENVSETWWYDGKLTVLFIEGKANIVTN